MTNANLTKLDVNERPFQVDYKENLAGAFKMLEEVEMSLDKDVHNELIAELGRLDRAISDLEHTIEFVECNASQGYALFKRMQDVTRARRIVKERIDERNKMMSFINSYRKMFKGSLKQQLNNAETRQKRLDSQRYALRELTDLQPYISLAEEQKARKKIQAERDSYMAYQEVQYVSLPQM